MDQQRGRLPNVFRKHIFVLNVACNNCAFCLQVLLVYKIKKQKRKKKKKEKVKYFAIFSDILYLLINLCTSHWKI